ncbi:MAG: 5-methyltetrahydropteroyltriglutamate--homocysteine S-methyltransferase, partial [Parvibaculales bacterium]
MIKTANLGMPRMGENRELKRAIEAYWKGDMDEKTLEKQAKELRVRHWEMQRQAGLGAIPCNDFSFYDHVLDMVATLGAIPPRYGAHEGEISLSQYFAMARGLQKNDMDVVAMEMTKWFDTNYHYIVPEFHKGMEFSLSSQKIFREYEEAKALGVEARPVILGPVSFLLLGKAYDGSEPLALLPKVLPVYREILQKLEALGATEVQIDEPCLVLDLSAEAKAAYGGAYKVLADCSGLSLWLTSYFGGLEDNLELAFGLPVQGVHVDLVRGEGQLGAVLGAVSEGQSLSLGVINGRNIWKTDLTHAASIVERAVAKLGADRVRVAPSCSLLHVPMNLEGESKLDDEFKSWLAFAKQKLQEIALLARFLNEGEGACGGEIEKNREALALRARSERIHNEAVQKRVAALGEGDAKRISPFSERVVVQEEAFSLPLLPITTIGSFPQTAEVRKTRAAFKKGELSRQEYDAFLEEKTAELMKWQDETGIDVPVHGEYERNDMVEYFGEKLEGYAFTENGWVQSYGTRCVKPPIIFGDVSRPEPMTVRWSAFAQGLTKNPVKGMLTGPVTMLQWAFIRDDQPREITCRQIALAIRDEVCDLEKAGVHMIQIDEPAFREGLPLRRHAREAYLQWAVEVFRISSCGIEDSTQIHTHMCYSEF